MNANKQDAGGVLPCPFCATEECGVIETSHGVWGACGKCGTCGPFTTCKEDALAAWNRRAELCRAAPAGGECQHEWQPDADVMNARYCPKCDVTQTIPRKPKDSAPAGSGEVEARDAYSRIIKALAAIACVHTPDDLFDLNAIPRDPVMLQVMRIRQAADELEALLRKLQQGAE